MFTIERNAGALYEQIESAIIKYIVSGVLKSDEQLPSVRNMAKELNVNPNTVQRAYNELESKGMVYTIVGKGVFISGSSDKITEIVSMAKLKVKEAAFAAKNAGVSKEEVILEIEKAYLNC